MVPARSVVLAGIKHCGKTTLGRLLARHWGVPFLDTDAELEAEFAVRHKRSAGFRDIYRELGEEGFRRLEAEVIDALADGGSVRVIALGGGVVANPFLSPDALRKLGFGVWLDLKPEIAYPRILRRGLPPSPAARTRRPNSAGSAANANRSSGHSPSSPSASKRRSRPKPSRKDSHQP